MNEGNKWGNVARGGLGGLLAGLLMLLGMIFGIVPTPPAPPPPPPPPPPQPPPDVPPPEQTPDPLAAIVRISSGNVGCSATVVGPRRPDGRYWVLSAAHCVNATGQKWTARFRDGRSVGLTVVNFDRRADWSWMVTDGNNVALPFALPAERSPVPGEKVWHAGFGVDVPANREDGEVRAGPDGNGQVRFWLSVSNGDSGGGIVLNSAGRVIAPVCCTTRLAGLGDVWGAAPEQWKAGQRDTVDLDEWVPLDMPQRPIPKDMPPGK